MGHAKWEFDDLAAKFVGKTNKECYKLIWQWAKQEKIGLSLFTALCKSLISRTKETGKEYNCKLDRGICSHQFGRGYQTGCSDPKHCDNEILHKKV